jgi:hypothetical protein
MAGRRQRLPAVEDRLAQVTPRMLPVLAPGQFHDDPIIGPNAARGQSRNHLGHADHAMRQVG